MNSVEMIDIVKQYPLVRAVDHVSFSLGQGEIHSLLGRKWSRQINADENPLRYDDAGSRVKSASDGKPVKIKSPKRRDPRWGSAWCISTSCFPRS